MTGQGPYAGDIDVAEAWRRLEAEENAILLDVRTRAEWQFVGLPDLAAVGKRVVLVEWQRWPEGAANPDFAAEVAAQGVPRDAPLLAICRSGQRSRDAAIALTAAGFGPCYNVAGGFEGPLDGDGRRGRAGGWKAAGLPWRQS